LVGDSPHIPQGITERGIADECDLAVEGESPREILCIGIGMTILIVGHRLTDEDLQRYPLTSRQFRMKILDGRFR
jgi:hypothetical protein